MQLKKRTESILPKLKKSLFHDDVQEHEEVLSKIEKKQEKVKLLEKGLLKHHKTISSRVQQLAAKERSATQRELAWIQHRSEMQRFIDIYDQKKRLLDDEIKSKMLLLENIQEKWSEQVSQLKSLKLQVERDVHHVKQLIDADLHALYEKESQLKFEADDLSKQKAEFAGKMQELGLWKQHSEHVRKREEVISKVEKDIQKTKDKIQEKYEKLRSLPKEINKPEAIIRASKPAKQKFVPNEETIRSLIESTRLFVQMGQLREAKENIVKINKLLPKLKHEKKHVLEYEVRDLKTSIKLASL